MRLPVVHRLPVFLAGQRILIALAQVANIVGLHQLIEGGRVRSELLVIKLEGPLELLSAMDRLHVPVALNRRGDLWNGDRQTDQHEERQEENPQQHVSGLGIRVSRFAPAATKRKQQLHKKP